MVQDWRMGDLVGSRRNSCLSGLAINGGEPVRRVPFPHWPQYAKDEIGAVEAVLTSGNVNYWTGSQAREFENEFASYCETAHAVALANGTVALELALKVLEVGPGDEVIVTPRTFFASASAIALRGATAVFADVDLVSQNITAETIEAHLTSRTKAIVAVHLAGWPCDMDAIRKLANRRNLYVIEDCAQAHGATYRGKPVGSLGHIGAFSFCQDKIMSTGGEGGMLVTNDKQLWKAAWEYKDHGKSYDAVYNRRHAAGFRWLHESFGTNWRMTEMQAVIGRLQLKKLRQWVRVRREYSEILDSGFAAVPCMRVAVPPRHVEHSYYKYYAFVEAEELALGWDRDRIMEAVCAEGIPCFSGSCPEVYLERAFRDMLPLDFERLPGARRLGETSLMFLVHPTLSEVEIRDTVKAVKKVMAIASGPAR